MKIGKYSIDALFGGVIMCAGVVVGLSGVLIAGEQAMQWLQTGHGAGFELRDFTGNTPRSTWVKVDEALQTVWGWPVYIFIWLAAWIIAAYGSSMISDSAKNSQR